MALPSAAAFRSTALTSRPGMLVQLGLVVVGFGAVVLTYFGLQDFHPTRIDGGTEP